MNDGEPETEREKETDRDREKETEKDREKERQNTKAKLDVIRWILSQNSIFIYIYYFILLLFI